jgi:hypothetical protein
MTNLNLGIHEYEGGTYMALLYRLLVSFQKSRTQRLWRYLESLGSLLATIHTAAQRSRDDQRQFWWDQMGTDR